MSLNYAFMADLIGRIAGPSARVLDYGCGAGQFVTAALECGHDAYGCDNYEGKWSMWAGSASDDRIWRLGGDGRIPFPNGHFDVVTANQVFEHIDDFERPLAEIHRVLKAGGCS